MGEGDAQIESLFCRGGRGWAGGERVGKEEETESLILLFVVLDLLEGRWW